MTRRAWLAATLLVLAGAAAVALFVPNPLSAKVAAEAKYRGLMPYTTDEAIAIAYGRCTGCHNADKILKYCARCGPPFIVVTHTMKKYVELSNRNKEVVRPFSDAELVAITQAWNAMVGNWEAGWGEKNLKRLLQNDGALIALLETPIEQRPIETALKDRRAPGAYKEQ